MLRNFEKAVMLQTLDGLWKEHLAAMDHLRQGIHLRGYAQKNPKQEYKRESFDLFTQMLETLKRDVVSILSRVQVQERDVEAMEEQQRQQAEAAPRTYTHAGMTTSWLTTRPRPKLPRLPSCGTSRRWDAMTPARAAQAKIQALPRSVDLIAQ